MRIATLGLFHEANTFSPIKADRDLYAHGGVLHGEEIVLEHGDASTTMGGFLAAGTTPDVEVVPLLFAYINPIGPIVADVFEDLLGEMLDDLDKYGPWDAVLLALHGAAVAEHTPDADGEIAARVRQRLGRDVVIGATFDLHANLSTRLIDALDVATVYQTNPHVDAHERARKCADLVISAARGEIRPRPALVPLPLVVNITRQDTSEEPMAGLMATASAIANRPGMLDASLIQGFPYADVPHMGMSAMAIHDGDDVAARQAATELADAIWAVRTDLQARGLTPDEALDIAGRAPVGPVVLLDVGDNIGGGAPGDSTVLLAAAQHRGIGSFLQALCDPEAVTTCMAAGTGATVRTTVGARQPHSPGHPVRVEGTVRLISDGRYEDGTPTHGGFRFFDMGRTVVLDTTDGHTLVLTSKQVLCSSLQQHRSLGIEPTDYHVVVAKGVNSPRAAYGRIARRMLTVDTEGITAMGIERFDYQHRRTPLYPFEDAEFGGGNR
ncbi:M81 family metallopeptidase [Haloechinothrix salitolerans]|uniref:M81 family metallopeptidase n=1 Tax=Haloechinothrix salitolerans TaxID=926830 RepID=A0ABW2BW32_9PSEU